jgi:ketosteroid isomerase-like protein
MPRSTTPFLAGIGAAVLGRAALHGAMRATLRRRGAALMAGDPGPLLALIADDARLTFPGVSSWGRTYEGRDEYAAFLRRFIATGLRGEIVDVLFAGPPWATRMTVRFDDWIDDPDGTRIYANQAVLVLRTRFGKVVSEHVFEDTQKVAALDALLEERGAAAAAASATVTA